MRSRFSPIADAILGPLVRRKLRQPITTSAGNLTQADVDIVAEDCGAPAGSVRVEDSKLFIYPNADIMVTDRLLQALQATGQTTLTAIGNQKHRSSDVDQ